MIEPAKSMTKAVAPVYGTVTKRVKVTEGRLEWAPILCETNVTGDIVRQVQSKLNSKGYNAGTVDGVYGWQTTSAVKKYQQQTGLATGGLTLETIKSLGVKY